MKLAVEERESEALLAAIASRGPYVTSVVGEIETVRVCNRARVPPGQIEEVLNGIVVVALDEEVRRLAAAIGTPTLRTLDAIHLATAVSLRDDLTDVATYDVRLAEAVREAGFRVLAPT